LLYSTIGNVPRQFSRAFTLEQDVHHTFISLGDIPSPQPIEKVWKLLSYQKAVRVIVVDQNDNNLVFAQRIIF